MALDNTNQFRFTGLSIQTVGFYVINVQIISSDNKYNFNATSNYIRIVSKNFVTDTNIADTRNIVFQFTGDNTNSLQQIRIAMFGNLLAEYNLTVQGPIYIYFFENYVYLTTSISVNAPAGLADMVNTLINVTDPTVVIPGLTLKSITYYDSVFAKDVSISASSSSSSAVEAVSYFIVNPYFEKLIFFLNS